jgi:hypothetical protein
MQSREVSPSGRISTSTQPSGQGAFTIESALPEPIPFGPKGAPPAMLEHALEAQDDPD